MDAVDGGIEAYCGGDIAAGFRRVQLDDGDSLKLLLCGLRKLVNAFSADEYNAVRFASGKHWSGRVFSGIVTRIPAAQTDTERIPGLPAQHAVRSGDIPGDAHASGDKTGVQIEICNQSEQGFDGAVSGWAFCQLYSEEDRSVMTFHEVLSQLFEHSEGDSAIFAFGQIDFLEDRGGPRGSRSRHRGAYE